MLEMVNTTKYESGFIVYKRGRKGTKLYVQHFTNELYACANAHNRSVNQGCTYIVGKIISGGIWPIHVYVEGEHF